MSDNLYNRLIVRNNRQGERIPREVFRAYLIRYVSGLETADSINNRFQLNGLARSEMRSVLSNIDSKTTTAEKLLYVERFIGDIYIEADATTELHRSEIGKRSESFFRSVI